MPETDEEKQPKCVKTERQTLDSKQMQNFARQVEDYYNLEEPLYITTDLPHYYYYFILLISC